MNTFSLSHHQLQPPPELSPHTAYWECCIPLIQMLGLFTKFNSVCCRKWAGHSSSQDIINTFNTHRVQAPVQTEKIQSLLAASLDPLHSLRRQDNLLSLDSHPSKYQLSPGPPMCVFSSSLTESFGIWCPGAQCGAATLTIQTPLNLLVSDLFCNIVAAQRLKKNFSVVHFHYTREKNR